MEGKGNDEVKAVYGSVPLILQVPVTPDPAIRLPLLYLIPVRRAGKFVRASWRRAAIVRHTQQTLGDPRRAFTRKLAGSARVAASGTRLVCVGARGRGHLWRRALLAYLCCSYEKSERAASPYRIRDGREVESRGHEEEPCARRCSLRGGRPRALCLLHLAGRPLGNLVEHLEDRMGLRRDTASGGPALRRARAGVDALLRGAASSPFLGRLQGLPDRRRGGQRRSARHRRE